MANINNIIEINGINYRIVDRKENYISRDSFTHPSNKIGTGSGAWEWHIGSKNDVSNYTFFGGEGFDVQAVVSKKNLLTLMHELKFEYNNPSQNYREKQYFNNLWATRIKELKELDDFSFFRFSEHDNRKKSDTRLYAKRPGDKKRGDNIYGLIRKLLLPNITTTSILKLSSGGSDYLYYFNIFSALESKTRLANEIDTLLFAEEINDTDKKRLVNTRLGQGHFRETLLKRYKMCPITSVSDPRLLLASHIKPWRASNNQERLDPDNGILLSPTFDRLFDVGLITFLPDKSLLLSPWLNPTNLSHLKIGLNQKFSSLKVQKKEYFEYHFEYVFKN